MMEPDSESDIDELFRRSGMTLRTVRYNIQRGLLPSPGSGRGMEPDQVRSALGASKAGLSAVAKYMKPLAQRR